MPGEGGGRDRRQSRAIPTEDHEVVARRGVSKRPKVNALPGELDRQSKAAPSQVEIRFSQSGVRKWEEERGKFLKV